MIEARIGFGCRVQESFLLQGTLKEFYRRALRGCTATPGSFIPSRFERYRSGDARLRGIIELLTPAWQL